MAAKGSSTGRKTTKSPAVKKTGSKSTKTTAAKTTAKKANTTKNTKSAPKRETTRMPESRERFGDSILDEVILIVIIVISAVVFISQITSKMGVVGQVIGGLFQGLLGISGVLLPVLVIIYCIWMLMSEERKWSLVRAFGGALFLLTVASAAYLFHPLNVSGDLGFAKKAMELFDSGSLTNGGLIGGLFGGGLFGLLDALGSVIVLLAMLVISIILATGRSFFGAMGTLADHQKVRRQVRNEKIKNKADRIRQEEKMEAARLEKQEAKRRRVMNKEDFNIELHEVEATEHPEVKETVFRQKKQDYSVKKREPIYDFVKENEMPMEEPKWDFNVVFGGKLQVDELEQGTQMPPKSTERFKVVEPLKEVAKKQEPVEMTEEEAVYEKIFGEDNTVENMAEETPEEAWDMESRAAALAAEAMRAAEEKTDFHFADLEDAEETASPEMDMPEVEEPMAEEEMPVEEVQPVAEEMPTDVPAAEPAKPEAQKETAQQPAAAPAEPAEKPYVFPPISLLGRDPGNSSGSGILEQQKNGRKLEMTLKSFGVEARVINVSAGPTVTRYEVSPSQGVKVSKIVNLADDIALNLAASGIRIEAPIPGKAAVGIEVPNKETKSVYLRTVLESDAFRKHPSKLAFALGEDITGNPIVTDIAKMPHLLIAGATGSGKSVCINTLITSILYKADPKEVKLLLVDPKVVELSVYNGIPHLLIPVVTDPKKASAALNWAVREMLERYNDFAACGVRDIKGFNAMKEEKGEPEAKMPQIVIIIDELADLMMAAPGEVEDSICRLAQMARAAGMHLIIATQRPSVDVITGVIKANIPSRLAFAVSSGIDSRTILDMVGAEKLLGKGDMLFYPSGQAKPSRIQGAFVTDKEVEQIVDFLRKSSRPGYTQEMVDQITAVAKTASGPSEETDEFFEQAVDLILEKEKASVSMLQRQFRIGYNRAARLMDELERRGLVGPEEGSKPRKVLITRAQWEEMQSPTEENA
ncbi:DNA segregation ATPase FtsK/SpoIIIE, S-DNA-T family [[Clostridium] lactatifermentans DSM 14214]|uniref:DNA segregation ATPase FtsK/SpoIIIE, S-DNA-T family n=2 Tax=Anaerotignum lactatifermentans TaxID=160404 RepID=A0A1M6X3E0_9FIRM|nr:DNA segregation ATPase FtsK/SpoIIIE, S-DNA-T family [[Clostridium] lactatifermentans DSM 14214] [Anaerotignum lactatifermentans DSM 14214]